MNPYLVSFFLPEEVSFDKRAFIPRQQHQVHHHRGLFIFHPTFLLYPSLAL